MRFLAAVDALPSLESMKFPVFSLLAGNFGLFRDEFAADSPLQRRVRCEPLSRGNSPSYVEKPRFSAGVGRSVGGAVGGDAQGGAISHQGTAMSLSAPIPVPPCCRRGFGTMTAGSQVSGLAGTCRFRLGVERGLGSRKAEHGALLMPGKRQA